MERSCFDTSDDICEALRNDVIEELVEACSGLDARFVRTPVDHGCPAVSVAVRVPAPACVRWVVTDEPDLASGAAHLSGFLEPVVPTPDRFGNLVDVLLQHLRVDWELEAESVQCVALGGGVSRFVVTDDGPAVGCRLAAVEDPANRSPVDVEREFGFEPGRCCRERAVLKSAIWIDVQREFFFDESYEDTSGATVNGGPIVVLVLVGITKASQQFKQPAVVELGVDRLEFIDRDAKESRLQVLLVEPGERNRRPDLVLEFRVEPFQDIVNVVPTIDWSLVTVFFLQPENFFRVEPERAAGVSFHLCRRELVELEREALCRLESEPSRAF